MPFYQFGEMIYLDYIATEDWIPFIQSRFEKHGKHISEKYAQMICEYVGNYSSYVQQLAWNVMAETEKEVTQKTFDNATDALLAQCSGLFVQQTQGLTSYQMNFIRALCNGFHDNFSSKTVSEMYPLGTKSNISRIKNSLIEKELIEERKDGIYLSDIVFERWFKKEI